MGNIYPLEKENGGYSMLGNINSHMAGKINEYMINT
jgi:hypothetical protein